MKDKLLTITEIIDAAVEMGFDIDSLYEITGGLCTEQGPKNYELYAWTRCDDSDEEELLYVRDVTIQDLVMCDEFMKLLYGFGITEVALRNNNHLIREESPNSFPELLGVKPFHSFNVVEWMYWRIWFLMWDDWKTTHKEISDRIKFLKERNEK